MRVHLGGRARASKRASERRRQREVPGSGLRFRFRGGEATIKERVQCAILRKCKRGRVREKTSEPESSRGESDEMIVGEQCCSAAVIAAKDADTQRGETYTRRTRRTAGSAAGHAGRRFFPASVISEWLVVSGVTLGRPASGQAVRRRSRGIRVVQGALAAHGLP